MGNFWDYNVWGNVLLFAVLFGSLLIGNALKKTIPYFNKTLIPTSVIGGTVLIIVAGCYKAITGEILYDNHIFGENGTATLEVITYHALALGFIASTFKTSDNKLTKKRSVEILNTGVATVSTYLIQAITGIGITLIVAMFINGFFPVAGALLPFGFGQGTGQAMNYGNIYETQFGFEGGKSFGLTIAALGFISASFGGVIHLNYMKRKGRLKLAKHKNKLNNEKIESKNEIPMQESIDKMTIQVALVFIAYVMTYIFMYVLGILLPGMKSTIYGFNFLLGVLSATLVNFILKIFKKGSVVKKEYTNNFLMTRISNFFFDIMVVAGIAAIRLDILGKYWSILLILGIAGLLVTYGYNRLVAKKLFPEYVEEQFLAMYGMLTGTASTGVILLREVDSEFKTPASSNLVYQNFPAIVLGFPIMLLATLAPAKPILTLIILVLYFIVMNLILFRSFIFRRKTNEDAQDNQTNNTTV